MRVSKRYVPVAVITVLCLVAAVVGYLKKPATSAEVPLKVLLDNTGGKVVFAHAEHNRKFKIACGECHHEQRSPKDKVLACETCHVKEFDEQFAAEHMNAIPEKNCVQCHHTVGGINFDHDAHASDYAGDDCTACHHDASIEPEPQNCADCHAEPAEGVPGLEKALHGRCISCHEEWFTPEEEGAKPQCSACHQSRPAPAEGAVDYAACATCHVEPVKDLVPVQSQAFHAKCMGCHEKADKGPYRKSECSQCHMK